eukprot:876008-Pyramimonas_sp.AAC.1
MAAGPRPPPAGPSCPGSPARCLHRSPPARQGRVYILLLVYKHVVGGGVLKTPPPPTAPGSSSIVRIALANRR